MTSAWKHNHSFLSDHGFANRKKSLSKIVTAFVLGLMILGISSGNLYLFSFMVENNIVAYGSNSEKDLSSKIIRLLWGHIASAISKKSVVFICHSPFLDVPSED